MKPDILICDEVVSALDVSIQGQILNLLLDLRNSRKSSGQEISFLFIAHNLKVASYFCDRIGVMYRGEIMEEAPASNLWKNHLHPYTELLFSSVQGMGKPLVSKEATALSANIEQTNTTIENPACAFASRCPYAESLCIRKNPPLQATGEGHLVRCWKQG